LAFEAVKAFGQQRTFAPLISDLIGKKVDLRTAGDLSRYFRSQVLATAVPQYAA